MYSEFLSFEELKRQVVADKESGGPDVSTRCRYPIRFVLFDNFSDSSQFVEFAMTEMHAVLESVDKWLDADYPDIMITHTQLASRFKQCIKGLNGKDCVIAPFSELARFYDNGEKKTFDALLKTIKAIEASAEGVALHQRVYVPIVGLEGKMEAFGGDTQSTIWRLAPSEKDLTYRLVLTNGTTYGVKGLETHYTIVRNMREWLNLWKDTKRQSTPNIISTSPSIFANAVYAQPDNAFTYVSCRSAYEFLSAGLQLQVGGATQSERDGRYWLQLAEQIDIARGFSLDRYVEDYFAVNGIDTFQLFVKLWFEHYGGYERWLLARYYERRDGSNAYVRQALSRLHSLIGNELVEIMAADTACTGTDVEVRACCLKEAARHRVTLPESVALTVTNSLEGVARQYGALSALKYFTGISEKENELAVSWISKGEVGAEQIKSFFPDLCHYLDASLGAGASGEDWIADYIAEYRKAKVANKYTDALKAMIKEHNASEAAFDSWYQRFSTVRTLLARRRDIEVFYWVDGLGIDWIPFVKAVLNEKRDHKVYLNEVMIARALLPSTTAANKPDLQRLLPEGEQLQKAGDLDSFAHQSTNTWPSYVVRELQLVREIIDDITSKYNGKKVAIVSDHGLSYMPQLCSGLGMAGVEPDHHGRVVTKSGAAFGCDSNYMRAGDSVACALGHNSLCGKVPKGQGIHGGCTPEEVLVPIFIVSGEANAVQWTATLLTATLSGADPVLRFAIKNLPAGEAPVVKYNGGVYRMHSVGNDEFVTEAIIVDAECTDVSLEAGGTARHYNISVSAGAAEDDLFGDF